MSKFRRSDKRKSHGSLEGFLPSTPSLNDAKEKGVHQRFRTNYKPPSTKPKHSNQQNTQKIDSISSREEGFTPKASNQGLIEEGATDSLLWSGIEAHEPKKGKIRSILSRFRRKKGGKSRRNFSKNRFVRGAAISMAALVLAVGSLFAYGYVKTRQIFKGNGDGAAALQEGVDPSKLNGEGDGRVNVLLLGKGGPGHTAPDLTDTILLASIDPIQNEAALLSVPRDMYVQDDNGYSTKINAVYANAKQAQLSQDSGNIEAAENAGLDALKQSVSEVLGVPIHYYGMVNFKAFEDAINIVGGLDIYIEEALYDWSVAWLLDGNPLVADQGWQTLDGKRALLYARSRRGSARGDFDRTERQREILVALQHKVLSAGTYSNPFKVVDLLSAFGDNVRTDLNGVDELRRLYEIGKNIGQDKIQSVGLADDPVLVTTDFVNNQSIVRPVAGLYQYDEIHSFVRNTLRDAFLKQEDARIIILNGSTTAGLATAKEEELKSYGYNVVSIDNAPTDDYASTRLIDLSNGEKRYTQSYLERRLGVSSEQTYIEGLPTNETADFVIILGSDEAFKTTSN